MQVTALVPMRHESERVPGKNYRMFHGRPLFHHILETLSSVPAIDRIVVDTDSPTITSSCSIDFPAVVCVARPPHLRDGRTPMTDVLQHDIQDFPSQWYLQTHSTNPLLKPSTVVDAIAHLEAALDRHDSLFTVSRIQARLFDAAGAPINHDPNHLLRTQDLPPILMENSNLYLFTREQIQRGRRYGDRPVLFEMDPLEAVDIDDETGFRLAEAIHGLNDSRSDVG